MFGFSKEVVALYFRLSRWWYSSNRVTIHQAMRYLFHYQVYFFLCAHWYQKYSASAIFYQNTSLVFRKLLLINILKYNNCKIKQHTPRIWRYDRVAEITKAVLRFPWLWINVKNRISNEITEMKKLKMFEIKIHYIRKLKHGFCDVKNNKCLCTDVFRVLLVKRITCPLFYLFYFQITLWLKNNTSRPMLFVPAWILTKST